MVGRSKRPHVATFKEGEVSKDDDIVCLDIPVKQRGRNKTGTRLKVKVEKKSEEKSNEFAGFDVEDATEEEKRQLREAILASTNDQKQRNSTLQDCEDTSRENCSSKSSQKTEASTADVIEINSEEDQQMEDNTSTDASTPESGLQNVVNDIESAANDDNDEEDDDETQPPSDIEENDFVLNLDQPTLDETKMEMSDTESTNIEETDKTLSGEDLQEDFEMNKPEESGGFDVDVDKDYEDDDNTVDMDYQSEVSKHSEYRQRTRRCGSQESFQQSGSKDAGNGSSLKSSSQGSLDSMKEAVGTSGSKPRSRTPSRQSSRSSSLNREIGTEHVPLKRHYRGVRPEFNSLKHDVYFGTNGTKELEKSALAIYQLFEIYRTKLKMAQRKLGDKITWSEPVKTGQHQSRTLDVKRRGKESIYIDLSDMEEDFQDTKVGKGCRNQKRNLKTNEDEAEFPELIIESESSNDSLSLRKSGRKPPNSRSTENDIMSAETQPYDIDTNDDEDFVTELKTRVRGRARADTQKENLARKQFDQDEKEIKEKPTRGRPRKKVVQKVVPKVLVEETQQEDIDLQEALRISRPDSQISVEETQPQEEEFDWISARSINEKEELDNQPHKENIQRFSNMQPNQKYAKSHNKVIFQEKNILEDDFEKKQSNVKNVKDYVSEETISVKVDKPAARGRKRKAKRQAVVTLVEETQDLDVEERGPNVSQIKRKRNFFKLESGSEEDSIAETQDIGALSDNELEERTEANRVRCRTASENSNNEKSGVLPSTVMNAKDFVSPVKNELMEEDDEEGSQSPVIIKKKTYSSVSKKMYTKPCARKDIDCEEEPFKSYKANSTEKKFKAANSSNFFSKDRIHAPFTRSNIQEENEIPEGVKRFINRPSSKESNASDNISTTSSQMSTNILDEDGDLYSTQFCEIKARKGKSFRSKNKSKSGVIDSGEEILTLDGSDDDIPVLKESKKTYAVKRINRNLPVTKDGWPSRKRDQKVSKYKNIQQFFSKVKQPGDLDVPIELDQESDEGLVESEVKQRPRGYNKTGTTEHSEELGKHSDSKSKYKNVSNIENEQNLAKTTNVFAPDIVGEMEEEKDKADVYPVSDEGGGCPQDRNILGRPKKQVKGPERKTLHHLNLVTEDSHHALNDLSNTPSEMMHHFKENQDIERQNKRNIKYDTNMLNENTHDIRRHKRVSETVTSADDEERTKLSTRRTTRDQNEDDSEATGHMRNDKRKRVGHHISDKDFIVKKKIETVECPLCSRQFPVTSIEQHAATCEGLVDEDEVDGITNEEENVADIIEHNPDETDEELGESLPHQHHQQKQNRHQHHQQLPTYQHLHDQDHHNLSRTAALHGHHSPQDGQASGSCFIQDDKHVKDVAKDLSCSPGEEGELQSCYICDEQVPKGKQFEVHVKRCLAIAAQQQAEVDEKGFSSVYAEPEAEDEVQVRTLRGRQVNNDRVTPSRGKASRGRHIDGSPGDRRHQKREFHVESRGAGDGEEDSGEISRHEARESGLQRRGLTRRLNKNKISQNDDGSGHSGRY